MSTAERKSTKGHSGEVSVVAASAVSLDRSPTFFRIRFPSGMNCTSIRCKSGMLHLAVMFNDGKLNWVYQETKGKAKQLIDDPSRGNLCLVGAVSDDGRVFLHEDLVANGNREQAEAYCERLFRSLSGD